MILGMETHFRDASCRARHRLRCSNNFPLLPEEVNQLEIWFTALGQQILGVMAESQGNDFFTLELSTTQNFPSFVCLQIIDNEQWTISIFCKSHQFLKNYCI